MLKTREWSLAVAVELMAADLSSVLLLDKAAYIGTLAAPLAWMVFVLQYTGRKGWLSARNVLLAAIIPIVTLLLDRTRQAHHMIFETFELVRVDSWSPLKATRGPLGLAVCRRSVEGVGGTLTMSSEVMKGSCFAAIIPAKSEGATSG